MRAYVYVDGFNLYYGSLRKTKQKWLNLQELFRLLLPRDSIIGIKYYTARVKPQPHDPSAPLRQQMYLRALETLPNLSLHYGHFLTHTVWMPDASSKKKPPDRVQVIKTEEKGSDVNLATHLVRDGFRNEYELAVLVTNDSDLLEPIRIVRHELGLKVGIINPHKRASQVLVPHANFIKTIRHGLLSKCQFPDELTDSKGTFRKPSRW